MRAVGARAVSIQLLAGAVLAALQAAPAAAKGGNAVEPYFFFSQPGLTREQVRLDFEECRDLAGVVQPPSKENYVYTPGLVAAGVNGFLEGLERGEKRRYMADAAWRKCMAIKGYQRYAMAKDEAKALYDGGWSEQRDRMADRALAPVGDHRRIDP